MNMRFVLKKRIAYAMQPHPKHHLYNMQLLGQKNMINIVEITRKSMDDTKPYVAGGLMQKKGNIGKKNKSSTKKNWWIWWFDGIKSIKVIYMVY